VPLILALLAASPAPAPVTVLFSGDVTLGFHYELYVDELVAKGMPKDEALVWGFKEVRALTTRADLFVVNLECPFTDRGEKIPKNFNFRARPELIAALLAGGVDVASLANNHLMDFGPEGIADTINLLDTHHIAHFGAGATAALARAPVIVEAKGVRFAFLGYFFMGDRNIDPVVAVARGEQPGVAGVHSNAKLCEDGGTGEGTVCRLDDAVKQLQEMVETDVRAAKQKADHVIPFFHWGREAKAEIEPYQAQLARAAIDAGASAVVGSHPHVLQGMEVYKGAPIVYSLGNFVFGGNLNPKDKRTALVELSFTKDAFKGAKVIPATSDAYPDRVVQPALAKGEEAEGVLAHLREISKDFKTPLLK